jgi:hypothetical protein
VGSEPGRLHLPSGLTITGDVPTNVPNNGLQKRRPEHRLVGAEAEACVNHWSGTIRDLVFLGADQLLLVEVAPGFELRVRCRAGQQHHDRGGSITVGIRPESLWVVPHEDQT